MLNNSDSYVHRGKEDKCSIYNNLVTKKMKEIQRFFQDYHSFVKTNRNRDKLFETLKNELLKGLDKIEIRSLIDSTFPINEVIDLHKALSNVMGHIDNNSSEISAATTSSLQYTSPAPYPTDPPQNYYTDTLDNYQYLITSNYIGDPDPINQILNNDYCHNPGSFQNDCFQNLGHHDDCFQNLGHHEMIQKGTANTVGSQPLTAGKTNKEADENSASDYANILDKLNNTVIDSDDDLSEKSDSFNSISVYHHRIVQDIENCKNFQKRMNEIENKHGYSLLNSVINYSEENTKPIIFLLAEKINEYKEETSYLLENKIVNLALKNSNCITVFNYLLKKDLNKLYNFLQFIKENELQDSVRSICSRDEFFKTQINIKEKENKQNGVMCQQLQKIKCFCLDNGK